MKLNRILLVNLLFITAMFAISIWTWQQLPPDAQIPTRFDFDGTPTTYMGKMAGLLLSPTIALAIAITDLILPKIEPNQDNIRRSSKAYNVFSIAIIIFFAIVHATIVLSALDKAIDTTNIISIALGGFMVIIGNYFSKIRRNYSFGFRTPWTLSSDLAWHKTHRWAGWLTVIHGLAFIVVGLFSSTTFLVVTLISFSVVSIIVLPIYSYLLWKSDSNRSME